MTTAPRKRIRIKTRATTPEALVFGLRGLVDQRGFFVRGAPSLPIGAPVALELMLADGARVLQGEGVVDRLVADGARAGMGLALAWDADSRAWLERLAPPSIAPPAPVAVEPEPSTRPEVSARAPAPRTPTAAGTAARGLPPLPPRLASGVARRNTGDLTLRPSTGDLARRASPSELPLPGPTPTGDLARRTGAPVRSSVPAAPSALESATEPGVGFAQSSPPPVSLAPSPPPSPDAEPTPAAEAALDASGGPVVAALPSIPVSWPAEAVTPAVVHPWEAPPRASDAPFVAPSSPGAAALGTSGFEVSRSPVLPIEPPVMLEDAALLERGPAADGIGAALASGPLVAPSELMPFALAPEPSFATDPHIAPAAPRAEADPLEALSIVDPVWSDLPAEAPTVPAVHAEDARAADVRAEAWSGGVVLDVAAASVGPTGSAADVSPRPTPRVSVDLDRWAEPEAPKKGGVIGWLKRAFSSE